MFKKILLATSATHICDYAAKSAFNLADLTKAHICIFHVLGVPFSDSSRNVIDLKTGAKVEVNAEYIEWVKEEIKIYYARQLEKAESYDIKVTIGSPHIEILRESEDGDHDLVVMGGSSKKKFSAYKKNMMGSTVSMVAKDSRTPLMVLSRPNLSFLKNVSGILFCTDLSKNSNTAFDFSFKLAKFFDCGLNIFHVIDISRVFSGMPIAQDEIEAKVSAAFKKITARYSWQIKDVIKFTADAWEGVPYIEMLKYAREKKPSLIVIASHDEQTDIQDKSGCNMEQVIVRSDCPVIIIKH